MNRSLWVGAVIAVLFCAGGAARGDLYAVGKWNTNDQVSGVWHLNPATGATQLVIATPGIDWYGATDALDASHFYAIDGSNRLYLIDLAEYRCDYVRYVMPAGDFTFEIGWDDSGIGLLYGAGLRNLYQLDPNPSNPTATYWRGPYDPANASIEFVYAMDYVPSVGLLAVANAPNPMLHTLDTSNGAATPIAPVNQAVSDLVYDHNSGNTYAVGGRTVYQVNPVSGDFTQASLIADDLHLTGLANATHDAPLPNAKPLLVGTIALNSSEVSADVSGYAYFTSYSEDPFYEDGGDIDAHQSDCLIAFAQDGVSIDYSDPVLFRDVTFISQGTAEASVDPHGVDNGVTVLIDAHHQYQHANFHPSNHALYTALTLTANASGEVTVGCEGMNDGEAAVLRVLLDLMIDNARLDGHWSLTVTDLGDSPGSADDVLLLDASDQTGYWVLDTAIGRTLHYDLTYTATPSGPATDTDWDVHEQLRLHLLGAGVAVAVPEPATLGLLLPGGLAMVLRRR